MKFAATLLLFLSPLATSQSPHETGTISFIQVASATPQTKMATVSVTYPAAQTAGDLNLVVVGWNDTTATVQSVKDSTGNSYILAIGPTKGTGLQQSIYYAANIVGGATTVTVTFNQSANFADIRILEYRGVTTLDAKTGASGSSTAANSGSATTTSANELIFGADTVATGNLTAGANFTLRILTSPDSDLAEDRTVTTTGTYSATATLISSGNWVMQMATFSAISGAPPTVSSVSPNSGSTAGGTAVTITGTNFAAGATVTFGVAAATNVVLASSTTITATTPAGTAGAVTVTVTVNGQSGSLVNGFTYTSPATTGKWQILTNKLSLNPVHGIVMTNGKVLFLDGTNASNPIGAVWDPATQKATNFTLTYSMFCGAMVALPDGRPFVVGGTIQTKSRGGESQYNGQPKSSIYDPSTGLFTDQANMALGRWYPTATVLSDGTIMAFSGSETLGTTNDTVEIFTTNSSKGSWSSPVTANWVPPLYPRLHLLPDGRIFYSGSSTSSKFYDLTTQTWTDCCTTNYASDRVYGSSVLLPLTPANGFKPKVMILGGGQFDTTTYATNTTETIDLSVTNPLWTWGPNMSQSRISMNATILPNGTVLATGGSLISENGSTASFNADIYHPDSSDPNYNTFTSAGANSIDRLYHSNALLLPDATVILTGSNPPNSPYETRIESYQPAYLFNSDGSLATRPPILSAPATAIGYNSTFSVTTSKGTTITSVVLIRPSAATHAFNMEQRLVGLSFTADTASGTLTVTAPSGGTIAPPGYYMLFILNSAGVPSIAQFIQLCPATGCI
jgi:Domain of unknown function (DUF1929)/IPT/TIG domain